MVSLCPEPSAVLAVTGTSQLTAARDATGDAAVAFLGANRRDDVLLCVSELLTNALQHGDGTGAALCQVIDGSDFVVSVSNGASAMPNRRPAMRDDQLGGRGLHIVEAVADHVRIDHHAGTVVVTCRFTR